MAITITSSDFTGKFELTINEFTSANLTEYIDRYSTKMIIELMGIELFNLWVVDVDAPPYDVLTNPRIFQSSCGKVYESKGIKDMLLGNIFFYYTRDIIQKQSIHGQTKKLNENSTGISFSESNVQARWNESVETYEAIQAYILDNLDVYPTYNGVKQETLIPYF